MLRIFIGSARFAIVINWIRRCVIIGQSTVRIFGTEECRFWCLNSLNLKNGSRIRFQSNFFIFICYRKSRVQQTGLSGNRFNGIQYALSLTHQAVFSSRSLRLCLRFSSWSFEVHSGMLFSLTSPVANLKYSSPNASQPVAAFVFKTHRKQETFYHNWVFSWKNSFCIVQF